MVMFGLQAIPQAKIWQNTIAHVTKSFPPSKGNIICGFERVLKEPGRGGGAIMYPPGFVQAWWSTPVKTLHSVHDSARRPYKNTRGGYDEPRYRPYHGECGERVLAAGGYSFLAVCMIHPPAPNGIYVHLDLSNKHIYVCIYMNIILPTL